MASCARLSPVSIQWTRRRNCRTVLTAVTDCKDTSLLAVATTSEFSVRSYMLYSSYYHSRNFSYFSMHTRRVCMLLLASTSNSPSYAYGSSKLCTRLVYALVLSILVVLHSIILLAISTTRVCIRTYAYYSAYSTTPASTK